MDSPVFKTAKPITSRLRWQLLACDLDGTLVGRDHKILDADMAAIRAAREAGLRVAICTGRNSRESVAVATALEISGPGVFVNGATVCDMNSGQILWTRTMPTDLCLQLVNFIGEMGHAVLILTHDPATGLPEYFITDHAPPHRATSEWLLSHKTQAQPCATLQPPWNAHIVRLTIVVNVGDSDGVVRQLHETFGDAIHTENLQSPVYDCHVVEILSGGVNKWTGVEQLCRLLMLDPAAAVAIGDDVNDLAMLRGASLSFAMGSAPDAVKQAAKRITAPQAQCGVAQAIREILDGA